MWGVFPNRYQKEVGPNDIAVRDVSAQSRASTPPRAVAEPESPLSVQRGVELLQATTSGAGTHDFKVGAQMSRERMAYDRIRNGDILLELRRRRAVPGAVLRIRRSTPTTGSNTWAVFAQDQWRDRPRRRSTPACGSTASRATCRRSRARRAPGSASAASRDADVFGLPGQRRAAPGRVLRPVRQRPHRAQGLLRPLLQPVRIGDSGSGEPERAGDSCRCAGTTPTATCAPIPASCWRRSPASRADSSRAIDPDAKRPYSDEINVGIEHS